MGSDPVSKVKAAWGACTADGPVDVFAYLGGISDEGCAALHRAVRARKNRAARVVLWLSTKGGDAHAAYRMARCLQRNYDQFGAYISTLCKSAGTLVVIGAHEVVMGDEAELGPLDIQIQKRDELWEYGSGLDSLEALDVIKARALSAFREYIVEFRYNGVPTKIASDVALNLTVGLLSPIASQLDPVGLGETNRRMRIANDYSVRLNQVADNLKPDALETLLIGYPSHGFSIDRLEAESLFSAVREPTPSEHVLFTRLSSMGLRVNRRTAMADDPNVLCINDLIDNLPAPESPDDNGKAATQDDPEAPDQPGAGESHGQGEQAGNGDGALS